MPAKPRTKGLNVVVIMADQLKPHTVGAYGHPLIKTPNIDRLAQQGTTFDAAYCASPLCAPARFTMMAGQQASKIGAWDNAAEFPSHVPTFAHYLRTMNYYTCLIGKMHFVGADQLHGFEERLTTDVYPADFAWVPDWENPYERIEEWYHNMVNIMTAGVAKATLQYDYDDEVAFRAERKIYELARAPEDTPFCLVTAFIHPHDPYATRQKYWDLYDHDAVDLPRTPALARNALDPHSRRIYDGLAADEFDTTENDIRNARHAYFGNVSYFDEQVGRLVTALEDTGLADNTVIVVTSDHGDMLGERGLWAKMSYFEDSARVPLIVKGPGVPAGKRVANAVSHVDLLPTLTDLASSSGAGPEPEFADRLDGRSLIPLIAGDGDRDEAIGEYMGECAAAPVIMIRRGNLKYIHSPTDPDQLYDVVADPDERNNLANARGYATRMKALRQEIADNYNMDRIVNDVILSQRRRRAVHAGMTKGRRTDWDYAPPFDAGNAFMRSHMEVSEADHKFMYPLRKPPKPVRPRKGSR
ncbi:MAG: choline-sulfatase [Rhodospirillales bacterium]